VCLGELAQVLELGPGGTAVVRSGPRTTTVSLVTLAEPVVPGDWLVCHSGFALGHVTADEAAEATAIRHPLVAPAPVPAPSTPPRKDTP
jgi:hydrogenase expression/formation protein HypC